MGGNTASAYCSCCKTECESQLDLSNTFELSHSYEIEEEDLTPKQLSRNGKVYNGQLRLGKKHGFGEQTWPNGATYKGYWRNGKMHGQGLIVHANGDKYEGQFQ